MERMELLSIEALAYEIETLQNIERVSLEFAVETKDRDPMGQKIACSH